MRYMYDCTIIMSPMIHHNYILVNTISSAGVGRTGTFITIDHVLEQVGKEGVVDIPAVIQNLRQQRTTIVQTPV